MASPAILNVMTQQIDAEREQVLATAAAEADRVRESARERAAARRESALAAAKTELSQLAQRSRERAEAEAEMVALTTKDTVTDELLAQVKDALKQHVRSDQFPATLDALLAELMAGAPSNGVVLVPPAHEAHCRAWLDNNGHGGMTVRASAEVADGVAVEDEAHTFRVTNTLTTRFTRLEGGLRKHCIQELFGQGA
ncbi:MAG: hypothetical protein GC168_14295 [Candidatus Hydrogenedens sp.]|nr:hypothetical protein [Candidatus Hydrogenedens sp.]